ncbi:class I SAM-dependent methyltransferase [Tautonia rosea]|uniref:class I SAM-dependent methyltransferase n=1 Tax=Tautonia rosea TaxID=2728037 RepID=UPI0014748578|nr:class I SAM-dependent methyltransferase [Tautonia rosea]
MSRPPTWRFPPGVNSALWEYVSSERLAREEADYFAEDPLTRVDEPILNEFFRDPCRLIDLGCGAGRLSLAFARRNFNVTAVDLSMSMLEVLGRSAAAEGLSIHRVRANLCRLEGLAETSFDAALCMYSTLGMIHGVQARRTALASARRVLRPGGVLVLHAHNLWLNFGDRQGRGWLLREMGRRILGTGTGDRRMTYRGIPGVSIHLYRWSELRNDLIRTGFRINKIVALNSVTAQPIRFPNVLQSIRAGGWIVFAD